MTVILHLVDRFFNWEQRLGLAPLLERLPKDRFRQHVAALSGVSTQALPGEQIDVRIPYNHLLPILSGPALRGAIERLGADLIYAWSPGAAFVAALATSLPIVLRLSDPSLASRSARMIRTVLSPRRAAISCAAELVRRRLVEGGVDPTIASVIRPGIDFGRLNQLRRGELRSVLGVGADEFLIVCPPRGYSGDLLGCFFAAAILQYMHGKVRITLPSDAPRWSMIRRSAQTVPGGDCLVPIPPTVGFEEVLVHGNVLLVDSNKDISTAPVALAMAANVPVVAAAGYAVSELISHKVNGLLYKQPKGKGTLAAMVRLLADRAGQERYRHAASGQAYAAFGMRTYIDEQGKLIEEKMRRFALQDCLK